MASPVFELKETKERPGCSQPGFSYARYFSYRAAMSDDNADVRNRIKSALVEEKPSESLYALLVALRNEGISKVELIKMLTSLEARHRNDQDETLYDAILFGIDVLFSTTHPRRIS